MRSWLVVAMVVATGCGHSVGRVRALPKAKPEALEAFKDGARLVRLGASSYDRALERLRAATEIDEKLWEAWYDIGWIEQTRRRPAAAAIAYERALAIKPDHAESLVGLVDVYLRLGRFDEAIAKVRARPIDTKSGALTDDSAKVAVALARAQRRAGKLDDATETLRQVLRLYPRSADALEGLGLVYYARKQYELAELVIRRALEIREKTGNARDTAETWNNLGIVALAERRDQEAFANFDQATRLDPSSTIARRNKAMVYLDCGDYGRAVDELKRATQDDPTDIDAFTALGVAYRGAGSIPEAERAYTKALALDPAAADALYDLAILCAEWKKEPARAVEHLTRFLESAPASHPRRKDAQARLKELAAKSGKGAQ